MGPLIDSHAVDTVQESIERLKAEGGEVLYGGERLDGEFLAAVHETVPGAAKPDFEIVKHETFGPLLYLMTYRDFDEAIAIHNDVPQGLTSSIFTNDVREAEKFVSAVGSDCGIANVNTGTSGAEIGGAFGGEKKPAAAARAAAIAGRATCGARRTRSISRPSYRWRRGSSLAPTRAARQRSGVRLLA